MPVNDLELPDCQVGFYDSVVVFDHRLAKAWILGMEEIQAVQFVQDPEPDEVRPLPPAFQEGPAMPEVRQRIERLLEEPRPISPERVRTMRAIQILAQIGNRESLQMLSHLAQGAPNALETQQARGALGRLAELAKTGP